MTEDMIETVRDGIRENVCPDFIHNRFDLYDENAKILSCGDYTVEVSVKGHVACIGGWLSDISPDAAFAVSSHVFASDKKIFKVRIENAYRSFGISEKKNHFRIELPSSESELESRLSSKGRYNIRREKRLLEQAFGEVVVREYTCKDVPDAVFSAYFKYKKSTHGTDYHLQKDEYVKKYHVSNIYVLSAGETIMAVVLSCEQCPVVYIENLTYNTEYAQFSPGQILYHEYLIALVRKGFREIFLECGDHDYKKRYGSIEETVYDNVIMRNGALLFFEKTLRYVKRAVKKMLRR